MSKQCLDCEAFISNKRKRCKDCAELHRVVAMNEFSKKYRAVPNKSKNTDLTKYLTRGKIRYEGYNNV